MCVATVANANKHSTYTQFYSLAPVNDLNTINTHGEYGEYVHIHYLYISAYFIWTNCLNLNTNDRIIWTATCGVCVIYIRNRILVKQRWINTNKYVCLCVHNLYIVTHVHSMFSTARYDPAEFQWPQLRDIFMPTFLGVPSINVSPSFFACSTPHRCCCSLTDEFRSKVACENDNMPLMCNPYSRIAIYSASFGHTERESVQCGGQGGGAPGNVLINREESGTPSKCHTEWLLCCPQLSRLTFLLQPAWSRMPRRLWCRSAMAGDAARSQPMPAPLVDPARLMCACISRWSTHAVSIYT